MNYTRQQADTRWIRCPGELEYQTRIADLMQKLSDLPTWCFVGIDHCSGTLPRPIMNWYMLMNSADRDENSLFEVRARIVRKTVSRDANGKCKNVEVLGIMVGWKDAGMYNMSNEDRPAVFKTHNLR